MRFLFFIVRVTPVEVNVFSFTEILTLSQLGFIMLFVSLISLFAGLAALFAKINQTC